MWRGFIKFWWTLICFAVIIGGFQFYRYYICYTPRYTCSATYTLHTESPLSVGESGLSAYTFTYNSATTERLSSIFSYAVSSSIVRKRICEDIGLPELPVSIVASCVPDSNLLTFTAIGLDPEMTYAVICSLSKNYNAITDYIIGKYNVLDKESLVWIFGSYENMLKAIHSTTGSEYDIKEDFNVASDTVYQDIREFITKNLTSDDIRKLTVIDMKEKIKVANRIKAHLGVPSWQICKFLHL
jgi:hypothetical protein